MNHGPEVFNSYVGTPAAARAACVPHAFDRVPARVWYRHGCCIGNNSRIIPDDLRKNAWGAAKLDRRMGYAVATGLDTRLQGGMLFVLVL